MTIRSLLEQFAIQLGQGVYTALSLEMEDVGAGYIDTKPSSSAGLRIRTGGLLRSFLPKNKWGLFSFVSTDRGLQVTVGSRRPYATIHETGGVIRAKRFKQTSRGVFPVMALYFFARYRETKSEYYKNLFLAVRKKGFVAIPARHYFSSAMEEFRRAQFPRLLGGFAQKLLQVWANKEVFESDLE